MGNADQRTVLSLYCPNNPKPVPMFKLIQNLLTLNGLLSSKIRSITAYDEALVLYQTREYKAAFPLLREAAELDNAQAMSILGTAYLFGQGCKENGIEAERWLKRAVDSGLEDAKGVLGMAYATGKGGCRIDLALAIPLLQQAAETGDEQSQKMLGMIERGEGMFGKLKQKRKAATVSR